MADVEELKKIWGVGSGGAQSTSAAVPNPMVDDLAKQWGIGTPNAPTAAVPTPVAPAMPMIGGRPLSPDEGNATPQSVPTPAANSLVGAAAPVEQNGVERYTANAVGGIERLFKKTVPNAIKTIPEIPGNVGRRIMHDASEAGQFGMSGVAEATKGPLGFVTGAPKAILGGLGVLGSPFTGAIHEVVGKPVRGVAGNRVGDVAEFAASAAIPIVPTVNRIRAALPSNKTVASIVEAAGPENVAPAISMMMQNPRLTLMDVLPTARNQGAGLVVTPGTHQNTFERFATDRQNSTAGSVQTAMDNAMGQRVNVKDKLAELQKRASDVGENDIQMAIRRGGTPDVNPIIEHIDNLAKPGAMRAIQGNDPIPQKATIERIKEYREHFSNPDGTVLNINFDRLHNLQASIRAEASQLLNSANGQDRLMGYELMKLRNKIVDVLDNASPGIRHVNPDGSVLQVGSYKQALAKYKDAKVIQEDFERGYQINRNTVWEHHPDFIEAWVNEIKNDPLRLQAAQQGARLAFEDAIKRVQSNPRGLAGTGMATNDEGYNLVKARMLFGETQINKMANLLRDERNIADTNQKLIQGSETARRTAAERTIPHETTGKELNQLRRSEGGLVKAALLEGIQNSISTVYFGSPIAPGAMAAIYGLGRLGQRGLDEARARIGNRLTRAHNTQMTDVLQSTIKSNPQVIQQLLDYSTAAIAPSSAIARGSKAVAKTVANTIGWAAPVGSAVQNR